MLIRRNVVLLAHSFKWAGTLIVIVGMTLISHCHLLVILYNYTSLNKLSSHK